MGDPVGIGGDKGVSTCRGGGLEPLRAALEPTASGRLVFSADDGPALTGLELEPCVRVLLSTPLEAAALFIVRDDVATDGLVLSREAAAFLAELPGNLGGPLNRPGCTEGFLGSSKRSSPSSPSSSESVMKVALCSCSLTAEGTLAFFGVADDGVLDGRVARRRSSTMALGAALSSVCRCGIPMERDKLPFILAISVASLRTLRMMLAPVDVFVRLPLVKLRVLPE